MTASTRKGWLIPRFDGSAVQETLQKEKEGELPGYADPSFEM
jgi:hypothetical protein